MMKEELIPLIRESAQGIFLSCWIQPRASKTSMGGVYGDALKIFLAAPPVDGKANAELCKFLAKTFNLPKSSIEIVSGETGRKKTLLLRNCSIEQLMGGLCL